MWQQRLSRSHILNTQQLNKNHSISFNFSITFDLIEDWQITESVTVRIQPISSFKFYLLTLLQTWLQYNRKYESRSWQQSKQSRRNAWQKIEDEVVAKPLASPAGVLCNVTSVEHMRTTYACVTCYIYQLEEAWEVIWKVGWFHQNTVSYSSAMVRWIADNNYTVIGNIHRYSYRSLDTNWIISLLTELILPLQQRSKKEQCSKTQMMQRKFQFNRLGQVRSSRKPPARNHGIVWCNEMWFIKRSYKGHKVRSFLKLFS